MMPLRLVPYSASNCLLVAKQLYIFRRNLCGPYCLTTQYICMLYDMMICSYYDTCWIQSSRIRLGNALDFTPSARHSGPSRQAWNGVKPNVLVSKLGLKFKSRSGGIGTDYLLLALFHYGSSAHTHMRINLNFWDGFRSLNRSSALLCTALTEKDGTPAMQGKAVVLNWIVFSAIIDTRGDEISHSASKEAISWLHNLSETTPAFS
jgi:hypothetical protein